MRFTLLINEESMIVPFCDRVLCPTSAHRQNLLARWHSLNSGSLVPLNTSGADARSTATQETLPSAVFGFAQSMEQSLQLAGLLTAIRGSAAVRRLLITPCPDIDAHLLESSRSSGSGLEVLEIFGRPGSPASIPGNGIALCLWPNSICVVVPVYNQARYLARALGSVTWQLGPQDEVIVVDDASTDLGNFNPAAAFRQRIMWLRNEPQRGVAFSRNRAIERSRAEWIKFLDADDLLVPFALEVVRRPETPFGPDTVVIAGGCHRVLDGRHLDYLGGAGQSLKDILHANPLLPSATFVRRLALLEAGLRATLLRVPRPNSTCLVKSAWR